MNLALRSLAPCRPSLAWIPALILASASLGAARGDIAPRRLPRANLLVFRGAQGDLLPVRSASDWLERRAEILAGMQEIMGPLPGRSRRCPLDPQIEEEQDCGRYVRRRIHYASEPGSRVPAYLLIPKDALEGRGPAPAVLALHPTDMQHGHRVVVEKIRDSYRAYGHDLAARGFVVVAPSYPLMAGYQPGLEALGYRSGTMKAIWDNIRALDLLDSMPIVQPGGYGAIGHSLGGHNALFTAVFDPRIRVVISSCGLDSFCDYYGGSPDNWQLERGWCQTRYMPRLAQYRGRLAEIPFDFHEIIGTLAPRAVLISAPVRDGNFRWESVDEIAAAAAPVFELHGAGSNLRVLHPDCAHDFAEPERRQAYELLERALSRPAQVTRP